MINVYVRESEQLDGQYLGDFSPSDLHQLPDLFKMFDTFIWDDPDSIGPCRFEAGQFTVNETGVFFEIIVIVTKE
jgi:hypothetical protein